MTSNIRIKEDLYSKPPTPLPPPLPSASSHEDSRMGAESHFETHSQKAPSFPLFPAQFYKNLFAASASLLQKPPPPSSTSSPPPSPSPDDEKAEDLSTPGPPPYPFSSSSASFGGVASSASVAHFPRNLLFSCAVGSTTGEVSEKLSSQQPQDRQHQLHQQQPHSVEEELPAGSTQEDVKHDVVTAAREVSSSGDY